MTAPPSGVPVSEDAGTPSALRADDALDALDFPAVLQAVSACAVGPLGAASVRARRPSLVLAEVRSELARVAEAMRLERSGQGLGVEPVPEVREALGRLRIAGSVLDGASLVALRRVLAASRTVAAELVRVADAAPRVAELRRPVPDARLERRLERALDDDGQVLDAASPALAAARSDVRVSRNRLIQRLEAILRQLGGDGEVTLRNGRYVIPVARDLRGRPNGIVHGESGSGATLFLEPDQAVELGNALLAAEARAEREALKVLRDLTDLLRPERDSLAALHAMCVAADDLVARARYAVAAEGEAPEVVSAPGALTLVNARHPLLLAQAAADPTAPRVVPFDLSLEDGERTVLLSGPNTGGKTVLLKAVGLCAALAQSGIVPPLGPGSSLPLFRQVFADIGDRQSISASLSTFSAHVATLRVILEHADDQALVLLDEVGSGTDPAEGAALASAALLSLTRRGAVTLATTHLGSLKQLATRQPGVVNASLQFDAATLRPTYRLLKGVPGRSYGLAIARRLGVPAEVLAEAEAQVPGAERSLDALLATVEERQREQEHRAAELAQATLELDALRARLSRQQGEQAQREAELAARERHAERAAREQARAYLLEARQQVEAALGRARDAAGVAEAREARRLVEEAARIEAERLAAIDREPAGRAGSTPGAPGWAPGDPVKLESGSRGEILELRADGKAVVRVGSLKLVVATESLRRGEPVKGGRSAPPRTASPEPVAEVAQFEVDLRGLSGEEAEREVTAAIDAAILAENPYLRIIHGKGTGVVRERVRRVVQRDARVKRSEFAPANQGGTGVTIVEFRG